MGLMHACTKGSACCRGACMIWLSMLCTALSPCFLFRGLTMRPWLRLLERIHDLPIEQLDQHMARTLADELGVPYQPVRDKR